MRAADVFEIHVEAFGRRGFQSGAQGLSLIVDHGVEARDVAQPGGLVVGAGGPDHITAFDLGDLGGDRTDGAGGGGDEHLLAVLQPPGLQQAAVSGQPRAAQGVHVHAERQVRVGPDDAEAAPVADEALAHARAVPHDVAPREFGVARGDHPADAAADQRLAQRLIAVEARAHVRVDRHQQVLDQEFAVRRIGQGGGDDREVLGARQAVGAADEVNFAAVGHWGRSLGAVCRLVS